MNKETRTIYNRLQRDFIRRYLKFMEQQIIDGKIDEPRDWFFIRGAYAQFEFFKLLGAIYLDLIEASPRRGPRPFAFDVDLIEIIDDEAMNEILKIAEKTENTLYPNSLIGKA